MGFHMRPEYLYRLCILSGQHTVRKQEVTMFRIPRHIGIIPDGNRRWARAHGLQKQDGYARGLEPGLMLLRTARSSGVQELTFYGFTTDNCRRPKAQVTAFSSACVEAVRLMEQEQVRICVTGNTDSACFPRELLPYTSTYNGQQDIRNVTGNSMDEKEMMKVNLLVNYGWEWDMKHNWVSRNIPRADLIIRWGGMCRLSGFLPLQSVYADFYIRNELWPDYKDEHFEAALQWYQKQDITLGG